MADGRSFEVRHRDFFLLGPNWRTAFAFDTSGVDISILDGMLMSEIEFGPQAATNASSWRDHPGNWASASRINA
jgi:hypothetical protein